MGAILRILGLVIKVIFKFVVFTGLYIPIIAFFIMGKIPYLRHAREGETGAYIIIGVLIISFVGSVLITIKNIIRFGKADFSYREILSNLFSNKKREYENIDKNLKGLESGIVLGKDRDYITMKENEEGHLLIVGGQGSGKTSTIAIPTLLNYDNPVFAIDIKGELSDISKNYRKNMKIFDPTNESTPHYDIYKVLECGDRVQGAREIVNTLIPIPKDIKDPYWLESAQNLLTSSILHFSSIDLDFIETCEAIMSTNVKELIEILSNSDVIEARMFVNQFVGAEEKQLASIYSTLSNNIILFATDKDIKRALSKNSLNGYISMNDLENGVDIFIRIKEEKIEQWKLLLSLITNQFLKEFEKRKNNNDRKILFLIDEFPRLGKIGAISNGLATLRSKGIQIMLIIQSLAQLDSIYGKDTRKIIIDNCNYKVVLKATEVETQEYFSKLVGTEEREKISNSTSKQSFSIRNNQGLNKTTEEKKIIRPEEFAYLGDKPVIFTPYGWCRANKVKYYEDKIFKERIGLNE